jgi:FlaA1/EpsC-like NDP-sugar epimerase
MIGQSDLDVALSVSIHSFAVSIPFLCSLIYTGYYEIRFKYTSNPAFLTLAEIIGIGGAMLGILALFWHFSWVAGSTFLVCSVLASVYAAWFSSIVEALNEEKTERN